MGNNNCRICHIGGRLWSLYKTSNDLIHFYRGSIDIPFLKPYNNMVLDGFHDIVVGILKKALSNILPSFQKCSSMTNVQMRNSILQYAEANNCFHYLNTLLHETVFDKYVSGGTLNKLTGSQINAMSFSLYNLMKDYINDNNVEVNRLKKVKNMIGILKSLLNLVVILSNGELDYKTAARYWEQSANNFIAGFDVETGFKLKWSIKVHNILHYNEMILHFKIPPYWMSTMRFENANFKLKQVLASTSSRINSPKTIVKKIKWMSFLQSYTNVKETYSNLRTWNYDIPLYEY
uniref:Uncharacterized protein n=1 Tax=Strongyloides papillosus TaxID=174720 RepID=A0A0N5C7V0_STREA